LPAFGVIRRATTFISGKKEVFRKITIVFAILSIALMGCVVWAHHQFTVGIDLDTRQYFRRSTIIIAIPTGVKIFRWIITLSLTKIYYHPVVAWVCGFIFFIFSRWCNRGYFSE
jgi:heme/copper-type cytochrome/quinol oxidase subunit 1